MLKFLTRTAAACSFCAALTGFAQPTTIFDLVCESGLIAPEETPAPAPASAPALPSSRQLNYQIPCLTVRGDDGNLSHLPMSFTRTGADSPLRIRIGDDTPNGSSKTIRTNVWLAALTAAMLRSDTLHGVNISIDFSGNIDGPSAGGVTCLAILSAIDGLPLPDDFAMTGTIMPDGSIGVVGGVQAKMRAAAAAGKKRVFIPVYPRFEKDAKGSEVDLLRLGDELKIKVHRVTTVTEAYALLHNKPLPPEANINPLEITSLPRAAEDVLTRTFKKYHALVLKKLKDYPDFGDVHILKHYMLSPRLAENLFEEGKLLLAACQILRTYQAWLAFENFIAIYRRHIPGNDWKKRKYLKEYYYRKYIFAFSAAAAKELNSFAAANQKKIREDVQKLYNARQPLEGFFPFAPGQTEITAQLEPLEFLCHQEGTLQILKNRRPTEKRIKSANSAELEKILGNEADFIAVNLLRFNYFKDENDFYAALGATMPKLRHNRHAANVEELFHAAGVAAQAVAADHLDRRIHQSRKNANAKNFEQNLQNNLLLNTYIASNKYTMYCHHLLDPEIMKKSPADPAYHLQATLKAQVYNFAMATALMVLYGPDLGVSSNFLPHLLRNARAAAIRNIYACTRAGIPCPAAVYNFGMAEIANLTADNDADRLICYWRAALYAKALMMSFKPEK